MPHDSAVDPSLVPYTGRGLLLPFRRERGDFANGEGEALVAAVVSQAIGTRRGELPWAPSRGLDLEALRNQNISDENLPLIVAEVQEALRDAEPRAQIVDVGAVIDDNRLRIQVTWAMRDVVSDEVLTDPVTTDVIV